MENTLDTVVLITLLIQKRDMYLKDWEDNCTIEKDADMPVEVDTLGREIREEIIEKQDILPVDFMIESLTKLGEAPNILYDDNGNFAITGTGFQSVSEYVSDVTMSFFVLKEQWFKTIREALKYYLSE